MDHEPSPIGAPGCVAHFFLNRGALGLSGSPESREDRIAIDVSDIDASVLNKVELGSGVCVLALGPRKWILNLGAMELVREGPRTWLLAPMAGERVEIPTRKSPRRELPAGAAQLRIDGVACPIINISEGGCAFKAAPGVAARLPLNGSISVEIECGQSLSLRTDAHISRVSYEIAQEPGSDALVSCQFMSVQASALLDTVT